MSSTLKTFYSFDEICGANKIIIEIPADISGDESAEIEFVKEHEELYEGQLVFSEKDSIDMANYIKGDDEGEVICPSI